MARDEAGRPTVPRFGERIRAERVRQGLSLRGLARNVGLSASLISQIETGKCQPSVSTLYSITAALGVSIEDVFEPAPTTPAMDAPANLPANLPAEPTTDPAVDPITNPTAGPATEPTAPTDTDPASMPGTAAAFAALATGAAVHPTGATAHPTGLLVTPANRELLVLDSGVTWERLGRVPGVHVDFLLVTYAPGGTSSSTDQSMRHAGVEYGYLIEGELTLTLGFETLRIAAGDAISFPSSTPHRYRNEGTVPAVGVWFVSEDS